MSNGVRNAQRRAIQFFESKSGKKVERFESRYLQDAFLMWLTMASEGGDKNQVCKLMTDGHGYKNPLTELFKAIIRKSEHTAPTIALSLAEKMPMTEEETQFYKDSIQNLRQEFNSLLGNNSVIIYPGFPTSAPYHNQALWTNPVDWIVFFGIFNALGLPSTQVCMGLDSDRLPVGVQLISNKNCDYLTMKLAEIMEKELGGWIEP